MNILLTGGSGQLGQELLSQLGALGRVMLVDRFIPPGQPHALALDLADLNRVEIMLNRHTPDLIVNAAAYTAVDRAEDEHEAAFRVNAEMPACLARWAARNDRTLLHYSTDYVFSGEATRPYREDDETRPLSVYGESKLAGEKAIAAAGCRHLVLRTSWVYSAHGSNFVLTMLKLARERPELSIVCDQSGCPTWARNLASVTRQVLDQLMAGKSNAGIYHYCDRDAVNWHDFACMIFEVAREFGLLEKLPDISAVESSGFPQKATRPLYSVLDTTAVQEAFDIVPAGLKASLRACLAEVGQNHDQRG